MRPNDHKRLIKSAHKLLRKAEAVGIRGASEYIYVKDYDVLDPEVWKMREKHYLDALGVVGFLAQKAKLFELSLEITTFAASVRKGGVKRIR